MIHEMLLGREPLPFGEGGGGRGGGKGVEGAGLLYKANYSKHGALILFRFLAPSPIKLYPQIRHVSMPSLLNTPANLKHPRSQKRPPNRNSGLRGHFLPGLHRFFALMVVVAVGGGG